MKGLFMGVAVLISTITTTAAFAKEQKCTFTEWRGAVNEQASISWVGSGFTLNEKAGIATVFWPNGYSRKENIGDLKIIKAPNFSTFKKHIDQTTFSYRIYNSGKCTGRSEEGGYTPITAKGRME